MRFITIQLIIQLIVVYGIPDTVVKPPPPPPPPRDVIQKSTNKKDELREPSQQRNPTPSRIPPPPPPPPPPSMRTIEAKRPSEMIPLRQEPLRPPTYAKGPPANYMIPQDYYQFRPPTQPNHLYTQIQRDSPLYNRPQYRPPPQRPLPQRPSRRQQPSTWQKLWRNVEKGLDGLADLEDTVTRKASELYTHTLETVKAPLEASSTPTISDNKKQQQQSPLPKQFDAMDYAFRKKATIETKTETTSPTANQTKKSDWNQLLLGATTVTNGGASEPLESPNVPPPKRSPILQEQPLQQQPTVSSVPPRQSPSTFEERESVLSRIGKSLPSLQIPRLFQRSGSNDFSSSLDAWNLMDEKKEIQSKAERKSKKDRHSDQAESELPQGLLNLKQRLTQRPNAILLSNDELAKCARLGRLMAFFDLIAVACIIAVTKRHASPLLHFIEHNSVREVLRESILTLISSSYSALGEWTPYLIVIGILAAKTKGLILRRNVEEFGDSVAKLVENEVRQAILYMKLMVNEDLPSSLTALSGALGKTQVFVKVRRVHLRTLFSLALLFLASDMYQPLWQYIKSMSGSFGELGRPFSSVHSWPPDLATFVSESRDALSPVVASFVSALKDAINVALSSPLQYAYCLSIALAFVLLSFIPVHESSRTMKPSSTRKEKDTALARHELLTNHIRDLSQTSASRLPLLSHDHQVEKIIERWRIATPDPTRTTTLTRAHSSRYLLLNLLGFAIASFPFYVFQKTRSPSVTPDVGLLLGVPSYFETGFILLFYLFQMLQTLWQCAKANSLKASLHNFITRYVSLIRQKEVEIRQKDADVHFQVSMSPASGIQVQDLWAAHTSKRAWALRGVNLSCRSGEILLLLGDDGSGRSRILTSIAETILSPMKEVSTTTKARGSIHVCGVETSKWNRSLLSDRVGLFLFDTVSSGNYAKVLSGLTLDEIFEFDGQPTATNIPYRDSCKLALSLTGLTQTLLPKLPSKWNTIVTTVEQGKDIAFSPNSYLLSPAEWSKLQLSQMLAHTIARNQNSARQEGSVDSCLLGSILLLDDSMLFFSENDESQLVRKLKTTGAATVMSSNRWSLGRFVDKIAIVKDGTIVETGSHNELLTRGSVDSIYAARWEAMLG